MASKHDEKIRSIGPDDQARFWASVEKTGACWIYKGTLRNGYGRFIFERRSYGAHRVAKLWSSADQVSHLFACHLCANRSCVNPSHLYWGTQKQNVGDAIKLGAMVKEQFRGEHHHTTDLSNSDVLEIWAALLKNPKQLARIARRYGVSSSVIYMIKKRRSWTYLTKGLPDIPEQAKACEYPAIERAKQSSFDSNQIEQICRMLDDGVSVKDVAAHAKSCGVTIGRIFYRERGRYPETRGGAQRNLRRVVPPSRPVKGAGQPAAASSDSSK